MRGIAGRILSEASRFGHDLVELMDAQVHRGADSTGFALYGPRPEAGYVVRAVRFDGSGLGRSHPVVATDTRSRHNLAIGLGEGTGVRMNGSVGHYCGGLNCVADIVIGRNAGWAVGEVMSSGSTGPRCGVAMKGGTIIVEGRIGYLSGFIAPAGRIIALDGRRTPVPTPFGVARSGWHLSNWRIRRAIGSRSYRRSGCGTSRAGTQVHG